jgi:hypothetical protein
MKTLKPGSFGHRGCLGKKVEAKEANRVSAKCAICRIAAPSMPLLNRAVSKARTQKIVLSSHRALHARQAPDDHPSAVPTLLPAYTADLRGVSSNWDGTYYVPKALRYSHSRGFGLK